MTDIATVSLSARRRLGLSWPLVSLLAAYVMSLCAGRTMLSDPDILWHIVTGRWIIEHGAVPHADFLSHTMPGAPWVAHEWLAEVIMAWSYDHLGWPGLVAAAGFSIGLALAIYTRAVLRVFQPVHALMVVALAWALLAPHWLARPHVFALPFLVLWMALLVEARDHDRPPPVAAALLMIPWANLHGSFLLGLGFAGLLAAEAVWAADGWTGRRQAALRWGAFIALAVLATLITPNGLDVYRLPLHLLDMKYALSILIEWRSPDFHQVQPLEVWLLLLLGAALTLGIRVPLPRLLMLLLLVHMALKHARHGEMLGFIGPLLVAASAAAQLKRRAAAGDIAWLDRWTVGLARPATLGGVALAALLMAAAGAAAACFPMRPPDRAMPVAAVQAAVRHGVAGPVLNAYGFGGYLVFAGIPTFIDGRADMYGDAFIERHFKATHMLSDELPALLEEYHIAWTLFPADSPAVVLLDHLPGWRRLYADDTAVVHVRTGPAYRAPEPTARQPMSRRQKPPGQSMRSTAA